MNLKINLKKKRKQEKKGCQKKEKIKIDEKSENGVKIGGVKIDSKGGKRLAKEYLPIEMPCPNLDAEDLDSSGVK